MKVYLVYIKMSVWEEPSLASIFKHRKDAEAYVRYMLSKQSKETIARSLRDDIVEVTVKESY